MNHVGFTPLVEEGGGVSQGERHQEGTAGIASRSVRGMTSLALGADFLCPKGIISYARQAI